MLWVPEPTSRINLVPLGSRKKTNQAGLEKFALREACFPRHSKFPFISVASVISSHHHDNPHSMMNKKSDEQRRLEHNLPMSVSLVGCHF